MITFEKVTDAAGHNVVGITFEPPIPWPLFDGGATSASGDGAIGDRIQAALEGDAERKEKEEKLGALSGALGDLADEITEECDGDLAGAKEALETARTGLRSLRGIFQAACRQIEEAGKAGDRAGAKLEDAGSAVRDGIRDADRRLHEARFLALKALLNPETIDLISEALSDVDAAQQRVFDAVKDLSKQAAEARGVL